MQDFTLDLKPSRYAFIYFIILYSLTIAMIMTAAVTKLLNIYLTLLCLATVFYLAYDNIKNHAFRKHKKSIIQLRFRGEKQEIILKNTLGEEIIKNKLAFNVHNSQGVLLDLEYKGLLKKPVMIFKDACDRDSFRRLHVFIQEHKKAIGEAGEKNRRKRRPVNQRSEAGES